MKMCTYESFISKQSKHIRNILIHLQDSDQENYTKSNPTVIATVPSYSYYTGGTSIPLVHLVM